MRKLLFTAVSLALCSGAHAAPITSTQSFSTGSITRSVSDTSNNQTPQTSPVTKSLTFNMFDSSKGVLVDVSSTLTFNSGTLKLSASGTKATGSGPVSFASEGSISATSSLPGMAFGLINEPVTNACTDSGGGAACFPAGVSNLSGNTDITRTDTTWLTVTARSGDADLNAYVGTGNYLSTLNVTPSITLTDEQRISSQTARLEVIGLVGTQSLTYSYLQHANASFAADADVKTIGFNDMTRGQSVGFSIFNLGDQYTTKLDMIGLSCTGGDCGAFNVTRPYFQDLLADASVAGAAVLATTVPGQYGATFALSFRDDTAVGATASHLDTVLTLDLHGSVAPVPEPGTWAFMSVGLIGLAFLRRKQ